MESVIRDRLLLNVNLLATGNTQLITIPDGYAFIPVSTGKLLVTEATGAGIGIPTVSVGTNASTYNNIYAATAIALGNLALKKGVELPALTGYLTSADGTIFLRVSAAATGFTSLKALLYVPYILVKL